MMTTVGDLFTEDEVFAMIETAPGLTFALVDLSDYSSIPDGPLIEASMNSRGRQPDRSG